MNPFTLSFRSKNIQESFRHYYTHNSLPYVRLTLSLAILLFILFIWLDRVMIPEAVSEILVLRILCIILFFSIISLTYTSLIRKYFQLAMSSAVVLGGIAIIGMIRISGSVGDTFYYAGLLLTIMYAHGLLRLRFIYASLTTWIVIGLYEFAIVTEASVPPAIILNNTLFLVSANIMGMFASYWLEYYMRAVFWQTQQLREKSQELEVEHGRKSQELETLRKMQLSMLPQSTPYYPGYEFSFLMRTATEIGGDYYDCNVSEDGKLTFAIGDATGHGAQAGAMVTALKVLFGDQASNLDTVEFLKRANQSVRYMGLRKLYMAFAIGKLWDHTLEIAGAGIPPALLYQHATGTVRQIPLKGMPLGSPVNYPYQKQTVSFHPGDTLLLMTDGYPELFNKGGEMMGYEHTIEVFKKHAENKPNILIEQLTEYADSWLEGFPQYDDITFLAIRRKPVRVPVTDGAVAGNF